VLFRSQTNALDTGDFAFGSLRSTHEPPLATVPFGQAQDRAFRRTILRRRHWHVSSRRKVDRVSQTNGGSGMRAVAHMRLFSMFASA
jgi:hypothetical protein